MGKHLPVLQMARQAVVLENLRIATPCSADWDEMQGDERVRFCGGCQKSVYNLSGMTRTEAEALIAERNGRLCVRLYQRQDGTVITSDCPVGIEREQRRKKVWVRVTKAAASVALAFGIVAQRAGARGDASVGEKKPPEVTQPKPVRMGAVAYVPPKPEKSGKDGKDGKEKLKPAPPRRPLMGDVTPDSTL